MYTFSILVAIFSIVTRKKKDHINFFIPLFVFLALDFFVLSSLTLSCVQATTQKKSVFLLLFSPNPFL